MFGTCLRTLTITAVIALALCFQNHVSEHRRLYVPLIGETVAIKPQDNIRIYDEKGKPYGKDDHWSSVKSYQKKIANSGEAPLTGNVVNIKLSTKGGTLYGLQIPFM